MQRTYPNQSSFSGINMQNPVLPETRNRKQNEKRSLEVSHIRNEEREKHNIKGEKYKQIINNKHEMFLLMKL